MADFEDDGWVIPPSAEAEVTDEERRWAELAIRGVGAVRDGVVRGFKLDPLRGSDESITIIPDNASIVMDMVRLRYGETFPDLFEATDA